MKSLNQLMHFDRNTIDWLMSLALLITGFSFMRKFFVAAFMSLYEYFVQGKMLR